jgi:enoyl-[acyl-carrier protein] reductase I
MIHPCDLTDPEQVAALHAAVKAKLGGIDFMVHAVAFAHKKDLMGSYADTSNEGFADAMDKSVYTFVTASRAAAQLLPEDGTGGSFITLSYIGGERVVPNYNVMGVAKAALESTTRYLAYDLGSKKIRVNAISAGPTMTLSARGISGFVDMYKRAAQAAPLGVNTTIDQVGDTCAFLVSDLARGITGDVIYVDNGLHIMAYAQ